MAICCHLSEISGAGVAAVRFAALLPTERWAPVVVMPAEGPLADMARALGVEVAIAAQREEALGDAPGLGRRIRLARDKLSALKNLQSTLRALRPALVWVHSVANIAPGLAARRAGVPILWHVHEMIPPDSGTWAWKRRIARFCTSQFAFASHTAATAFGAAPGACVLPNPLAPDVWLHGLPDPTHRVWPPPPSRPLRLLINGMFPRKGTDIVLAALREVGRPCRLTVLGDERPEHAAFAARLREAAATLPLHIKNSRATTHHVDFLGAVPDTTPHLAATDLYLSPSRSEALPILLVEAMLSGAPCVASAAGDQAELLGQGTRGTVVRAAHDDLPSAWAAAIDLTAGDPEAMQRALSARSYVQSHYAPEQIGAQVEEVLERALRG